MDAGFTAFMGSDGSRKSAFIGGDLIAIPVTTGAKDAALEYIEYVLSEAGQIEVYTKMAVYQFGLIYLKAIHI